MSSFLDVVEWQSRTFSSGRMIKKGRMGGRGGGALLFSESLSNTKLFSQFLFFLFSLKCVVFCISCSRSGFQQILRHFPQKICQNTEELFCLVFFFFSNVLSAEFWDQDHVEGGLKKMVVTFLEKSLFLFFLKCVVCCVLKLGLRSRRITKKGCHFPWRKLTEEHGHTFCSFFFSFSNLSKY